MKKMRFQKWPAIRTAMTFFAVGILMADYIVLGEEAGPYTVAKEIEARAEFNPVFSGDNVSLSEDEVFFVAEIPRGEVRKFEMRTATGQIIVDRTLCPRLVPGTQRRVDAVPATYGFSAGRFNVDGDPLDLLVLGREDLYRRMILANRVTPQRVRIVGILRMEECEAVPCTEEEWENDWKILAVDPADPEFRDTRDVSELSEDRLGEFVEFWSNYKGLSGGHPQTRVRGTAGRKAALAMLSRSGVAYVRDRHKEVSHCDSHVDELLERRVKMLSQSTPPPDEEFVECLGRVFSPAFFQTRESYDFLIQYGAYQLLRIKLKQQEVTLPGALARMQELRERRKTH
jgi:inorganic pyrophosphatase